MKDKKKFDWNAPMSRKDYATVCVAYYGAYAVVVGFYIAKAKYEEYKEQKRIKKELKNREERRVF